MQNFRSTYKKIFSILSLAAYLFITGYSLFHFHNTDYYLEDAINVEGKIYTNSGFHQNGICQLFHFNNNQFTGDTDSGLDYKPAQILINTLTFTSSLISTEINSLLRRGPPSII